MIGATAYELETQLLLSERLGFLSEKESKSSRQLAMETGRLLNGLRSSLVALDAK